MTDIISLYITKKEEDKFLFPVCFVAKGDSVPDMYYFYSTTLSVLDDHFIVNINCGLYVTIKKLAGPVV